MKSQDRFCWHTSARLFDASGAQVICADTKQGGAIPDRPAGPAICAALSGAPFRIGALDAPAPQSGFETLTSGSTGAARRVVRTAASWIASFQVNAGMFGTGPGAKVAVLGRLVQSLSVYGAVEALHLGADVHLLDGLRPDRQRAALAERSITHLWASPAQLGGMLRAGGPNLPALRHVLIGGAKLGSVMRRDLARLCPTAQVREFYGAAEASFVALADADTPDDCVGRPYPGVDISLRDPTGAEVDEGRIWVRSPYLATGYGDAGLELAEGWLGLGEVGRFQDGHLMLRGRIDRMVTVAGKNVFPEAIEAFLAGLPGVAQAAVIACPDTRRGHAMVAVVQGDPALDAMILKALRGQFGPLLAPKRLIWRDDLPLMPSGKVDLRRLDQIL